MIIKCDESEVKMNKDKYKFVNFGEDISFECRFEINLNEIILRCNSVDPLASELDCKSLNIVELSFVNLAWKKLEEMMYKFHSELYYLVVRAQKKQDKENRKWLKEIRDKKEKEGKEKNNVDSKSVTK